jgi:hypothetical protein
LDNRKNIILLLVAIALAALTVRSELKQLQEGIDRQTAAIEAKLDAAEKRITADQQSTASRIEQLEKALESIKSTHFGTTDTPGNSYSPERNPVLSSIKPGLYVLDRKIRMQNASKNGYYNADFTIYNIKAALGGEKSTEINIGLAVGDLTTPPVFYIDYNHDGVVDTEMMRDFASLGPLGPLLRRGINERNSQSAYDQFLGGVQSANFTSLESIEQSGQSIASSLWGFVRDQSKGMIDWIAKNDPTSSVPSSSSSSDDKVKPEDEPTQQ